MFIVIALYCPVAMDYAIGFSKPHSLGSIPSTGVKGNVSHSKSLREGKWGLCTKR